MTEEHEEMREPAVPVIKIGAYVAGVAAVIFAALFVWAIQSLVNGQNTLGEQVHQVNLKVTGLAAQTDVQALQLQVTQLAATIAAYKTSTDLSNTFRDQSNADRAARLESELERIKKQNEELFNRIIGGESEIRRLKTK